MKQLKLGVVLFSFLAGFAMADIAPPNLGTVKGYIVTGLMEKNKFEFRSGDFVDCRRNVVGDLVFFHCATNKTQLVVTNDKNGTKKFTFEKLFVQSSSKNLQYFFDGRWEEVGEIPLSSTTRLVLYSESDKPGVIRGSLKLHELGVNGGIQGAANAD